MKVFVSISGIYRCLPSTIQNLYENVIQTSPQCDFFVYVSVALPKCESVKFINRDVFELAFDNNDDLIQNIHNLFHKYNINGVVNVDDIKTSSSIESHESIVFARHSKNINRSLSSNTKFDTGVLMRTDTIFTDKHDISIVSKLCEDVMVIQKRVSNCDGGSVHKKDWDHCFISQFNNIELLATATDMMYVERTHCLYMNELSDEYMKKYELTSGTNVFVYVKQKMPSKVPDIRFIWKKGQVKRLWMWLLYKNNSYFDFNISDKNSIFIHRVRTQDHNMHDITIKKHVPNKTNH